MGILSSPFSSMVAIVPNTKAKGNPVTIRAIDIIIIKARSPIIPNLLFMITLLIFLEILLSIIMLPHLPVLFVNCALNKVIQLSIVLIETLNLLSPVRFVIEPITLPRHVSIEIKPRLLDPK
ncbi:hypothetical protein ACFX1S_006486 [Malus domestica]